MRLLIAAAFIGMMATGSADAAMTASEFYAACAKETETRGPDNLCTLYITGFEVGFYVAQSLNQTGTRTCLPQGIDGTQSRLVVDKFMRDHPEKLNEKVELVIMNAFLVAFPCRPSN